MAYYQNQGYQQPYAPPPGPPPQYAGHPQYAPPPGPPPAQAYAGYPYQQPGYQQPPVQYHQPPSHRQQYPSHQHQRPSSDQPCPGKHLNRPSKNGGAIQPYRPRVGFTNLPTTFHVWSSHPRVTSYLHMGSSNRGAVLYSMKIGSGRISQIKTGQDSGPLVGEARSKSMFSSKSIVSFQGKEVILDGSAGIHHGAVWPIEMPVQGRTERFEWRRKKNENSSVFKKIMGLGGFGNWELCPKGSSQPVATWTNTGSSSTWMTDGAELGVFQFHGQAAAGSMGDQFMAVAVISMMRMLHWFIMEKVASMAASGA